MNEHTQIDWSKLGFSYIQTPYRFQASYENGQWSEGELLSDPMIHAHESATVFNYGQSCFEGLKAQRNQQGDILLFRPEQNAARIANSADRLSMAPVPEDLFLRAVKETVLANQDYVPPYGTGASLYIRPVLFGDDPMISVQPAHKFIFRVFVTPVGPYYAAGKIDPIALAVSELDRAAPRGTGHIKAGGNYAAGIVATNAAKADGANDALYLDAETRQYLEEAGACNILVLTKDNHLITPNSNSILPSITRRSILDIASEILGLTVEERPIHLANELETFKEVAVCGTAAVLTPVGKIKFNGNWHTFNNNEPGETTTRLYKELTDLQKGDRPDPFGWTVNVSQA